MRRERRVDGDHQFRISAPRPLVVHDAVNLFNPGPEFVGDAGQFISAVAEDLDFDRLRRTFQIAEHILQDLHELNIDSGNALRDLLAQDR